MSTSDSCEQGGLFGFVKSLGWWIKHVTFLNKGKENYEDPSTCSHITNFLVVVAWQEQVHTQATLRKPSHKRIFTLCESGVFTIGSLPVLQNLCTMQRFSLWDLWEDIGGGLMEIPMSNVNYNDSPTPPPH